MSFLGHSKLLEPRIQVINCDVTARRPVGGLKREREKEKKREQGQREREKEREQGHRERDTFAYISEGRGRGSEKLFNSWRVIRPQCGIYWSAKCNVTHNIITSFITPGLYVYIYV